MLTITAIKADVDSIGGHAEPSIEKSTASITVHVDQTAPSANLPDEWLIWELVAIGASDSGSGVDAVELTIHGGSFGVRKYQSRTAETGIDMLIGSALLLIGAFVILPIYIRGLLEVIVLLLSGFNFGAVPDIHERGDNSHPNSTDR